jgi:hypothetical protein
MQILQLHQSISNNLINEIFAVQTPFHAFVKEGAHRRLVIVLFAETHLESSWPYCRYAIAMFQKIDVSFLHTNNEI